MAINMKRIYIVAEIGNTHEGSLGLAKCFLKAASECGVDAVKMQTHIFEAESLLDAPTPTYFTDESRKKYFERTAFSIKEWKDLKRYCEDELKIDFFTSPFSLEAVDMLEDIGVSAYKIASGEVSNIPLIEKIAKTKKRVFLSSGMSSWKELDEAIGILQLNKCDDLVILQCTSEYPCPPKQSGLNILSEIRDRYKNIEVGYSDHTVGAAVPLAAVVMGATVIEKHFTLSNKMYGSDAMNSTEPKEFKRLVDEIREVEIAVSHKIDKDRKVKSLKSVKNIFEKSIVSARVIDKNTIIKSNMLSYKKPGDGIPTREYKKIIGKTIKNTVSKDHKFKWEDFK
jgi:N,N'-diacetyllegionaminate synthase